MSEQESFEQVFSGIYQEAWDIMMERQARYGPENIRQQGLHGVVTRIGQDKMSRIKNTMNGNVVAGEVLLKELTEKDMAVAEDAFFDIANYALICISLLRGRWGLPMRSEIIKLEGKDE
jgi:hypothetical protein